MEILFGAEYLELLISPGAKKLADKFMELREANAVLLSLLHVNTWEALRGLGIDVSALRDAVRYQCAVCRGEYFWMMPVSLFGDVEKYKEKAKGTFPDWKVDHAFDFEYQCHKGSNGVDGKLDDLTRLFMGSGYTLETLYTDGHRDKRRLRVPLSDGNFFLVDTWVWYNK